jgi:hypothetical protein
VCHISYPKETSFEIIIRKARGKGAPLNLEKVRKFVDSLSKNKDNLQALYVETMENAKYDVIHDNLLQYVVELDVDDKNFTMFNRSNLYDVIRKEYAHVY